MIAFIDFLEANWYDTISLILSLTALVVAIQANIYARKNSTPTLSIKDNNDRRGAKYPMYWPLQVGGWNRKSTCGYELEFTSSNEFWISNNGGLSATLVSVSFITDFDKAIKSDRAEKWNVTVHKHDNPAHFGDVIYQLDVPAGSTVPVYVYAKTDYQSFHTKEAALSFVDSLRVNPIAGDTYKKSARYYFRFGDGTVLVRTITNANFILEVDALAKNLDRAIKE